MWLLESVGISMQDRKPAMDTLQHAGPWTVVSSGWVDVDYFPALERYCISEHEYELRRLMGAL